MDVIDDESRIESVRGEVVAIRGEGKGSDGVGVAVKRVENFGRSQVPDLLSVRLRTESLRSYNLP